MVADTKIELEAKIVKIAAASSPAVLGDKLKDIFSKHKHPTPNGLSDEPHNAAKFRKALSKAVKIS